MEELKKNSEIMEAFIDEASHGTKQAFKGVDLKDGRAVSNALFSYRVIKNEFIDSLVNKVFMTVIHSNAWKNPLTIFHGGMGEYGNTIEDLYVEASEKVGFKEHFSGSDSEIKDIIGSVVPKIYANYLSRNFADKYKITISDIQLRSAFTSETGLAQLVNKLMEANLRGAYRDEYKYMKDMIFKYCTGLTNKDVGNSDSVTKTQYIQDSQVVKIDGVNIYEELCVQLKAFNDRLQFESDKYNSAKVMQFSSLNQCVFLTTPEHKARLDVQYLAEIFNIEKAEVQQRIVLIDELPSMIKSGDDGETTHDTEECIGILMDKNLLRFKDFVFETRYFNNPNSLSINYFLHKQGLVGIVPFLNAIIFTKSK